MDILPRSLSLAAQYIGHQEDLGPNDGLVIRCIRDAFDIPKPCPWCGLFVAWILLRAYNLRDRRELRVALRFSSPFYVDSTRDWYDQAKARDMLTDAPEPGDLFLLLNARSVPHHIGFVTSVPDDDGRFGTLEGNTNAGGSVDGDGVYRRTRNKRGGVVFIALPKEMKA